MEGPRTHPPEWLRVPAKVFACLLNDKLRITLLPGAGMANGGLPLDVRVELVPLHLRLPNTKLWVQFSRPGKVEFIAARDE